MAVENKSNPDCKKVIVVPPSQVEDEIENPNKQEAVAVYKPQMLCVQRIKNLPVVVSILDGVSSMYNKIMSCSCITHYLCKNAEKTAKSVLYVADSLNSCALLQCPIRTFDSAVCLGIDFVECKIPGIKLPPEEIYNNSKGYVLEISRHIAQYPTKLIYNVKHYGTKTMSDIQTVSTCAKDAVSDVITVLNTTNQDQIKSRITDEETRNWVSQWKPNEIFPIFNRLSILLSINYRFLPSRLYEGKNEGKLDRVVEDCAVIILEFEMFVKTIQAYPRSKNLRQLTILSDTSSTSISLTSSSSSLITESDADTELSSTK